MRLAVLALSTMLLLPSAFARAPYPAGGDEAALVEHGRYISKDGRSVHRPAHSRSGGAPSGASARCRDGSWSFSQHRRGTCSRHGGVAAWR